VSSRGKRSKIAGVALRVVVGVSVVLSSGCAYFHPAFMTNTSRLSGATSKQAERGVLVCERQSLRRSACSIVERSELNRLLTEQTYRDLLR
jgi:hypothetical protein